MNDISQIYLTSPNFFMTSPKEIGRCHIKKQILPNKLGEVVKKLGDVIIMSMTENRLRFIIHYFSQISWEKSHFVMTSPKNVGKVKNCYDISQINWEKS